MRSGNERFIRLLIVLYCKFTYFCESNKGLLFVFQDIMGTQRKSRQKIVGMSYAFRVADITQIYDTHARSGLSNREILRRYIWPKYHICEKTFYNIINASADEGIISRVEEAQRQLSLF